MKQFPTMKIGEARQYAADGGQSLHMMTGQWATRTAASLGVRRVVVCARGTPSQHMDLCGKPLERAKSGATHYE